MIRSARENLLMVRLAVAEKQSSDKQMTTPRLSPSWNFLNSFSSMSRMRVSYPEQFDLKFSASEKVTAFKPPFSWVLIYSESFPA